MDVDDVEMSEAGAEAAPEAKMEPEVAPGEKVMMMMTMTMIMMMIVMKVMADSGVAATVSVSLHPLVIMNISEHWTR